MHTALLLPTINEKICLLPSRPLLFGALEIEYTIGDCFWPIAQTTFFYPFKISNKKEALKRQIFPLKQFSST